MDPFSVCQVTHNFYPMIGGAERLVAGLGSGMIRRGLKVVLVTRHKPGLPRHEQVASVPVYRLGTSSLGTYDSSALLQTRTAHGNVKRSGLLRVLSNLIFVLHTSLWLLLRSSKTSIIHVHSIDSPLFAAMLVRFLNRARLVTTVHGELNIARLRDSEMGKLRLWLLRRLGDAFIAISSECGRQLMGLVIEPSRVFSIPNGVDTKQFKPPTAEEKLAVRHAFDYGMSDQIALYVGKLIGLKRIDSLIRAWRSVSSITGAYLIVVGDGPERQRLEDLVQQSGLTDHVRFVGVTDDVLTYYQIADIFVLPSSTEGMSVALLEAMSCGLAVVVSDVPGNLQVVEPGGNGLSFPLHQPALLETRLLDVLRDARLRAALGRAARQAVVRDYSIETIVQAHLEVYATLLSTL